MARSFFDEMNDAQGVCRAHYQEFSRWLAKENDYSPDFKPEREPKPETDADIDTQGG